MTLRYGSVCSGIEAASVAWSPLGWEPAFFAEIEPFCNAVLAHRFPKVRNYGDFTKIEAELVGPIDLLVGGTPCQSFSVAGRRAGLDDPRGVLAVEFLRLAQRLRPRWLVWENVPGVTSSWSDAEAAGGAASGYERWWQTNDFDTFLGILSECGYGWAWRILDAQFTGVAQRRERVFVVGYLGDWRPPWAVLSQPSSLSGYPAPRRQTGEGVAATVNAGAGRRRGAGQLDNPLVGVSRPLMASENGYWSDGESETLVAHTLTANYGKQLDNSDRNGGPSNLIYQCQGNNVGEMGTLRQGSGAVTGGVPFVVEAYRTNAAGQVDPQGDRASALTTQTDPSTQFITFDTTQITSTTNRSNPQPGDPTPTLSASGDPLAIAFDWQASDGGSDTSFRGKSRKYIVRPDDRAGTVNASRVDAVQRGTVVRRLTPRECERLQGFPDDFTLVPYRRKPAADGPRYRAIGNSMAVPVVRWIGQRIALVDEVIAARPGEQR